MLVFAISAIKASVIRFRTEATMDDALVRFAKNAQSFYLTQPLEGLGIFAALSPAGI